MYLVDGSNEKIYIMLRDTLEILTSALATEVIVLNAFSSTR